MKLDPKRIPKKLDFAGIPVAPDADGMSEAELSQPTKVRITTFIDEDIIAWAKKNGKSSGIGYQTFLNQALRLTMMSKDEADEVVELALSNEVLRAQLKKVLVEARKMSSHADETVKKKATRAR